MLAKYYPYCYNVINVICFRRTPKDHFSCWKFVTPSEEAYLPAYLSGSNFRLVEL